MAEESTIENTIESKRKSLIIKTVFGELYIFLLCIMLYYYYKSKDKNILYYVIYLFTYFQIILLGLLYTYYYEIKNNNKINNNRFNVLGNYLLFLLCIFIITTILYIFNAIYVNSIKDKKELYNYSMISVFCTFIILYIYIKAYKRMLVT